MERQVARFLIYSTSAAGLLTGGLFLSAQMVGGEDSSGVTEIPTVSEASPIPTVALRRFPNLILTAINSPTPTRLRTVGPNHVLTPILKTPTPVERPTVVFVHSSVTSMSGIVQLPALAKK